MSKKDGKVNMTVPVFTEEQYDEFRSIMENYVLKEINDAVGKALPVKYAEYIVYIYASKLFLSRRNSFTPIIT